MPCLPSNSAALLCFSLSYGCSFLSLFFTGIQVHKHREDGCRLLQDWWATIPLCRNDDPWWTRRGNSTRVGPWKLRDPCALRERKPRAEAGHARLDLCPETHRTLTGSAFWVVYVMVNPRRPIPRSSRQSHSEHRSLCAVWREGCWGQGDGRLGGSSLQYCPLE